MSTKKRGIEEQLEKDGYLLYTTKGVSMEPMLHEGRTVVRLVRTDSRLKKYDVALFKRNNGSFVLHRVIEVLPQGYIIRGDNCIGDEMILESQILAVLESYYDGTRWIAVSDKNYLEYVHRRCRSFWLRRACYNFKRSLAKVLHFLLRGKVSEGR